MFKDRLYVLVCIRDLSIFIKDVNNYNVHSKYINHQIVKNTYVQSIINLKI